MSKLKTIFISGPISKVLHADYRTKFKEAEAMLSSQGYAVIDPSFQNIGFDYEDYIIITLNMLARCESIYMLKGWKLSDGAKLEHHYAKITGKTIIYEDTEC